MRRVPRAVAGFGHAEALACQNSREIPQIADEFRHVLRRYEHQTCCKSR